LFSVTNGLLSLLRRAWAGQAVVYPGEGGRRPSLGDEVWDSSSVLADDSLLGRALHAIIGYSDRPMGAQIGATSPSWRCCSSCPAWSAERLPLSGRQPPDPLG
jgi:hypothetical protein